MMRILLVLPMDSTYRYGPLRGRCIGYAPLTLAVLAALVPPELDAAVDVIDEGVQPPCVPGPGYDVVGISCVTSAAPRAYRLADAFRSLGSIVVLGGYHPSLNREEAALHADAVVAGPAEAAWPRLLREVAANGAPAQRVYRQPVPAMLPMPVPARHALPRRAYVPFPTLLASRGCGNGCRFCVTHRMWEGRACVRPVAEVVDELRGLASRRVVFLDSNLVADREHAAALFEALIPLRKRWSGAVTADLASDAGLLDLAVRSGCDSLLVGFESVDADSIDACRKRTNLVDEYIEWCRRYHDRGVLLLGCFIVGFDEDGEDVFERTLAFVDEAGIDLPRFAVLTPFPGTALFERLKAEGRILTEDWARYDERHAVFAPARMTAEALEEGMSRLWLTSCSASRIVKRMVRARERAPLSLAYNLGFRRIAPRPAQETPCA